MDPFGKPRERNHDAYSPGFLGGFPHAPRFDYSYDGTMRSLEQSLLRTGLSSIDVLLIHDCDVWTHGKADAPRRFKEAMDGAYRALDKLRSEKVVGAIGFGINEADTCVKFARAGDFDLAMMAGRYTLLDQSALDGLLPLALERAVSVVAAGVYNSGLLSRPRPEPGATYDYRPAGQPLADRAWRLAQVCEAHGVDLPTAAIHFPLRHPAVVSVVMGARTAAQAEANAARLATPVPDDLWAELAATGLVRGGDAPPA